MEKSPSSNVSAQRMATDPSVNRYGDRPAYRKKYYKRAPGANRAAQKAVYKRAPRVNARQELAIPVPECTLDYLKALSNPFDTPAGVCLPADVFPLPSQKVKVFSRGTFSVGTTGYGFIALGPTSVSNTAGISFSTSTSVMTSSTLLSAVTAVGTATFSKLPYTFADVETNNLAQARIVACGIRIRYNGTENNRNGTTVAFEEQDHTSILGYSYLTLLQENTAFEMRPQGDGRWDNAVCWSGPCQPRELEFVNDDYPFGPTGANYPIMGILVAGTAGDTYSFEVVEHLEFIGAKVPGKTKSHADPITYSKAIAAAKDVAAVAPLAPQHEATIWDRFVAGVKENIPQIISGGAQLVGGIVARSPNLIASGGGQLLMSAMSQGNQRSYSGQRDETRRLLIGR